MFFALFNLFTRHQVHTGKLYPTLRRKITKVQNAKHVLKAKSQNVTGVSSHSASPAVSVFMLSHSNELSLE